MTENNKPYKILWYSLSCLIDTSNGAAISNRHILEQLAQQGFKVKALTGLIADDPMGLHEFESIKEQVKPSEAGFYQFTLNSVEHFVVQTESTSLREIKAEEHTTVWSLFVKLLELYQPDLMIGYAPDLFSLSLRREAQARGIATVYTVCNASHDNFAFPDCDAVLTNSYAISQYYNRRADRAVKVQPFGIVIDPNKVLQPDEPREQRYVTMVNQTPYKGIAIFVGLVRAFVKKYPDNPLRFLIVKNRGDYEAVMQSLHFADGSKFLASPDAALVLSRIDVAENTTNMKAIYGLTKVMVCPSLCFEAWGMVATEANMSGIPVLAHELGGLPEAIGRQILPLDNDQVQIDDSHLGGIILPPAQSTVKDHTCIPSDEEIAPYLTALEHLLTNDYSQRCAAAAAINDPAKNLERFKSVILPLMARSQATKTPLDHSFFLADSYMAEQRAQQAASGASTPAAAASHGNSHVSAYAGLAITGVRQHSKKIGKAKSGKKKR